MFLVFFACLVLYDIESAFIASVAVIPSSHNIIASLCCNDNRFIPIVAIFKYDCKPILNTIVKKLFVVGTCKP